MTQQRIKDALDTILFDEAEEGLLRGYLHDGAPDSKLVVVVGDNATGKSFFVRILAGMCNAATPQVEPIQISMKYRTAAGMHRAFMYGPFGDEQDSTGNVSVSVLRSGFRTAHDRKTPHWLLLDEPDIGLSDSYARALGAWICEETGKATAQTEGVMVVTHSKALVRSLFANSGSKPTFVSIGADLTLDAWLADETEKSVEQLLDLSARSRALHRAIDARLDRK
jgi:hypothetical protein